MSSRHNLSRRNFIRLSVVSAMGAGLADGFLIEPAWLAVRSVKLAEDPTCRIAHFTDLHYKGDRAFLDRAVDAINGLEADFVCFTGDLVEDAQYLDGALEALERIERPVYGVPGNHEYWSRAPFPDIAAACESTGGRWLVDESATTADGAVAVVGATGNRPVSAEGDAEKRILLVHYPQFVDQLKGQAFDAILAGHSHGGQVRIPLIGAPILPGRVGSYDRGPFDTPAGPLYVNPGLGTWYLRLRFCCRPEVTLIEI